MNTKHSNDLDLIVNYLAQNLFEIINNNLILFILTTLHLKFKAFFVFVFFFFCNTEDGLQFCFNIIFYDLLKFFKRKIFCMVVIICWHYI